MSQVKPIVFPNDPPIDRKKYPRLMLTDDWKEKLKGFPFQAVWCAEDEPMVSIPGYDKTFSYSQAISLGVVRLATPSENILLEAIDMLVDKIRWLEAKLWETTNGS